MRREIYFERGKVYCKSCREYVTKKVGLSGKIWCNRCNQLIKNTTQNGIP